MLVIATDEAAYGPKLGPLVVAATVWHIAVPKGSTTDLDELVEGCFEPLATPVQIDGRTLAVDDSKRVFIRSSGPDNGLSALHSLISAAHHWVGENGCSVVQTFVEGLFLNAKLDIAALREADWLSPLPDSPLCPASNTAAAIKRWRGGGAELIEMPLRVITAAKFNEGCQRAGNKAELLSELTVELIRDACLQHAEDQIRVFCDRHGGRRYYAGVLQHVFSDAIVSVLSESQQKSRYEIRNGSQTIRIEFTVKGDQFAPVALASLHAKYTRERLMQSFNDYFAKRHQLITPSKANEDLKPTAGYPVDADRFLADIQPILERESIDLRSLVRTR